MNTIQHLQKLAGIPTQQSKSPSPLNENNMAENSHAAIHIGLDANEFDAIAEQVLDTAISIHGSARGLVPDWHQQFTGLIAARLKQELINSNIILDMWNDGVFDPLVKQPQ